MQVLADNNLIFLEIQNKNRMLADSYSRVHLFSPFSDFKLQIPGKEEGREVELINFGSRFSKL